MPLEREAIAPRPRLVDDPRDRRAGEVLARLRNRTGETCESVVKMTFFKGASLADPSGRFNASLDGNARRAIDFREGDDIDGEALKALVRAAVALNLAARGAARPRKCETRAGGAMRNLCCSAAPQVGSGESGGRAAHPEVMRHSGAGLAGRMREP